jgi:DNA-binding NarL/FixJ family response regulator
VRVAIVDAVRGSEMVEPPSVAVVASRVGAVRERWGDGLRRRFDVREVIDRRELEEQIARARPALVFLDRALPGLGGLDGVSALRRLNPPTKIVLLVDAPKERQAVVALVAGACGYCDRDIAPALALKVGEVIERGEIWIGRCVVPHLLDRLISLTRGASRAARPARLAVMATLAPREREIALLVAAGANNREIASRLAIAEATVKAHLTSVFRKVKVPDRLRLALLVTRPAASATARRRRGTRGAAGGRRTTMRGNATGAACPE